MGKRVRYRKRRFHYMRAISLLLLIGLVGSLGYWFFVQPSAKEGTGSPNDTSNLPEKDPTGRHEVAEGTDTDSDAEVKMPEINPDGEQQTGESSSGQADNADYVLGQPAPEGEAVDDSWFEAAVFLGDSRTEGLQLYSGITTGTFFWEWGMSVFKVDDTGHRKVVVNGEKMTLMEALSTGTWNKVYIMLGINDLGYPAQSYQEALAEVVDQVREIQSDAVIYLQTMPPVNESLAQANGIAYYINNENVKAFNDAITQVAQEKQVVLLDTASCLTDSQGQLPADMSSDGVHFKKAGYQTWLEYLKCHTVSQEAYQAAVEAA